MEKEILTMRKDVLKAIDECFDSTTEIMCPDGMRKFKTKEFTHIRVTFFDVAIIRGNKDDKPKGFYWVYNIDSDSGIYFFVNRDKWQKRLKKIVEDTRKEYRMGKKPVKFKKISPKIVQNYIESMQEADRRIGLVWKQIKEKEKLKEIEKDFS